MRLLRTLTEPKLRGKTCLVRVNLDIKDPSRDSLRLQAAVPTLRFLFEHGAKPIIISHRGRPEGEDSALSLKRAVNLIEKELGCAVDWRENLRFDPREEANNVAFAKGLAQGADIYINDDFATSHRKAASMVAITEFLPSYAGLHLEEEIKNLSRVRDNPDYPRVVILGGIKIEDKIGVIQKFENAGTKFLLGSAYRMSPEALPRHADIVFAKDGVGGNAWQDIGVETIKEYEEIIKKAKTVVWSGPVGKAENAKYAKGSQALAAAIIKSKAFSVAGGGDTADFLQKEGLIKKFDWVSTGGGAMLAFLSGEKLPGILALEKTIP